jgi:hypothetical protein
MHTLVRRYLPEWVIRDGRIEMFPPRAVAIERYRYRGTRIPTPWTSAPEVREVSRRIGGSARTGRAKAPLVLTEDERAQLLRWSRRAKSAQA